MSAFIGYALYRYQNARYNDKENEKKLQTDNLSND